METQNDIDQVIADAEDFAFDAVTERETRRQNRKIAEQQKFINDQQ